MYGEEAVPVRHLTISSIVHTRGHQHQLLKRRVKYDVKKILFH